MPPPTLLIATGNPGKLREYAGLLRNAPFRLLSLADAGIKHEVEETGATFAENAWLKGIRIRRPKRNANPSRRFRPRGRRPQRPTRRPLRQLPLRNQHRPTHRRRGY